MEGTTMDFEAIKRAAEGYRADMSRFLRDMIAIPSESCEEKGVVMRIKQELEKLGYDRVEIDHERHCNNELIFNFLRWRFDAVIFY